MKRSLFGLAILALAFVMSCTEDEPSIQNLFTSFSTGCKLKRVINSLDPEYYDVETFEYDSQGKLISRYAEYGQSNYTRLFFYNDKNQLIEVQQTSSWVSEEARREVITWKKISIQHGSWNLAVKV